MLVVDWRYYTLPFSCLLISVLLCTGLLNSQAADYQNSSFTQANHFYQQEAFDSALVYYTTLLNHTSTPATIHYNIANTYYKQNQIGLAVLHLEKTLQLHPTHKDAIHNLAYIQTKHKIPDSLNILSNWTQRIVQSITPFSWLLIICFFGIYAVTSCLLFFNKRSYRWLAQTFISICLLCISIILIAHTNHQKQQTKGIILTQTNLYSAPSSNGTLLSNLSEGTKVKIINSLNTWKKVSVKDQEGWVNEQILGEI